MSLQDHYLANQLIDQTTRLALNMRDNADDYIARANAGFNPVLLGNVMKADADQFLIRIDTVTQAVTNNLAAVQSAVAYVGDTMGTLNNLKTQLVDAANHVKVATLTTKQQCLDEAAAIKASVPALIRIFR